MTNLTTRIQGFLSVAGIAASISACAGTGIYVNNYKAGIREECRLDIAYLPEHPCYEPLQAYKAKLAAASSSSSSRSSDFSSRDRWDREYGGRDSSSRDSSSGGKDVCGPK